MLSTKPWRTELVVYSGIALFTSICVGAVISAALRKFHVPGFQEVDALGNIFLGTFTFQGVAWLLAWLFLRRHHVSVADELGLKKPQLARSLLIAALVFVVVLPVVWLLQAASVALLTKLGWPPENQLSVQLLERARTWWTRGYLAVFAVVLAPVAEEFIFRGVLYPFIKQRGWPKLAFVSTSFLFALIHFDVPTFLPLFVLALALTWLYEVTDVLLAPMLLHALFNATNLVMLVLQHLGYLSP